jgi:hypothetical protein
MPFPEGLEWNQPGIEPTKNKKDEGWLPEEKPPAEYFNWLFNRLCLAALYLNENKVSKGEETAPNVWRANQIYTIGDICYPKSETSFKYMECTVAGTSAAIEPAWGAVSSTIIDGTCQWKICDIRQGTAIGRIPALIDVGGGIAGLPAISGKLLTDITSVPTGTIMHVMSKTTPVGYLKLNGAAISRTVYSALKNASLTIATTGNTENGSVIITNIPTTIDMAISMPVESAGIPAGTTIIAINSLTSITLSTNVTLTATSAAITVFPFGNGDGATTVNLPDLRGEHLRAFDDSRNVDTTSYTLATTSGSNVLSGIDYTGFMFVGMPVSGTGIPVGATVASITSATAITISASATATSTATVITFTGRRFGSWEPDTFQGHRHAAQQWNWMGTSYGWAWGTSASISDGQTASARLGAETRGRNYAFPVYIKY